MKKDIFDSLPSEGDILAKCSSEHVKVTVICITYNHEKFIADSLVSILSQETDFRYEVIVHDDASQDKSSSIIEEFKCRYPNIIRPILQSENQYSKGIKPSIICLKQAQGEYVAYCDGDDLWLSTNKLQEQYAFLEDNKDYVMCFHDAEVIDEHGKLINSNKLSARYRKDLTQKEMALGECFVPSLSLFYRKEAFDCYQRELSKVLNGDTLFVSVLGLHGKGKFLNNISAAYRTHSFGIWSERTNQQRADAHINTVFWMLQYHSKLDSPYTCALRFKHLKMVLFAAMRNLGKTQVVIYLLKSAVSKLLTFRK